jgi:hypothetical protein
MFANLSTGQIDQTAEANALLNALSPAGLYGLKYSTTTGLTLGIHGGNICLHGVVTAIADYTGSLSVSTTNYVEAHPDTGAISKNTTGYTPGYIRIGRAVATTTAFTWTDDRASAIRQSGTLQKTLPSDANYTLTAAEAENAIYEISGSITATRNITIPLVGKRQTTCVNKTGQSLQFIGPTGTGVTVATNKTAIVRSDGTNIVRVTADV